MNFRRLMAVPKARDHGLNIAGQARGAHVPYRSAWTALVDLLAGQTQVMFDTLATSIGHIKADSLRALAVTSATRSKVLPDIPTVGEFVPGYEASGWDGSGRAEKHVR
jgi:tripartite-type tricarboxylate transporter receptor subunit TctC